MTAKKKRPASPSPEPLREIDLTPLAQQAQLRDLRLLRCLCSLSTPPQRFPPELQQKVEVRVSRRPTDQSALVVQISLSLVGNNPDGQEGLHIEATFALVYRFDSLDNATQEEFVGFARVIGLNNAWPYWREFVQSMTARMAIPPLRVPLLRMDEFGIAEVQEQEPPKPTKQGRGKTPR